jgi:hypothetical protein
MPSKKPEEAAYKLAVCFFWFSSEDEGPKFLRNVELFLN